MNKKTFVLIVLIFLSFSGLTLKAQQNYTDHYTEKVKLYSNDYELVDRLLRFRNFIPGDKFRRIVVNLQIEDDQLDRMIWSNSYIREQLRFLKRLKKFAFIKYKKEDQNTIIVRFFICDEVRMEAIEMLRLKVVNKRIVGINRLPKLFDGFTPL